MKVFVYGTLKRGYHNHMLLEKSKFIGAGEINGFEIYDLGNYPGIIAASEGSVLGEVYEIDIETLRNLDRLEGEGYLYLRQNVEVKLEDQLLKAETYVYNRPVNGRRKLNREWKGRITYVESDKRSVRASTKRAH